MRKEHYIRAIKVALVIGTLLNGINNSDRIINQGWTTILVVKVLFTYCVPFCVSAYSSWKATKS